jgi:hypothetical protein
VRSALTNLYNAPGSPHWDYHLNSKIANPAVDASVGSGATVDLDGNPRVGVPDLGAYELTMGRVVLVTPLQVSEGGKARIVIERRGDLSQAVTVTVSIVPGGSAQSGVDFTPFGQNGSIDVTFNPYEQTKTVELATTDNSAVNPDKTVNLALSIPAASASLIRLGDPATAALTIKDNDAIAPNPVSGFVATNVQPLRSGKGIVGAVIQFNAPLNAKAAKALKSYILQRLSGKGKFPKVSRVIYKAGSNTVTVKFSGPIRIGSSGRLVLNAAKLVDAMARHLGGNTTYILSA